MSVEQIIGFSLALLVMSGGIVGSIIPAIPSTSLVLLAAVGHRLYFGHASVGIAPMIALAVLTAITLLMDYIATMIGTKKLGGSWWGIIGSCIGALLGAFIPLFFIGIFIGTFAGAVIFEMFGGRELKHATRAGLGAMIGLLAGAIGKLAGCIAMIAIFSISVVTNTLDTEQRQITEPPSRVASTNSVPTNSIADTNNVVKPG